MEVLWAPWRLEYILGPKPDVCPFCLPEHTEEDRERLVLFRGARSFVIMNKYPYNNGHLMVTPYEHVTCLTKLDKETVREMMDLIQATTAIFRKRFAPGPEGINVGLNIGEPAGAGIREHLHFHIVPRWIGDSSFMAFASETRVIPEHLMRTYDHLKPYYDELQLSGID
jgi:ATP adenylyltransferase